MFNLDQIFPSPRSSHTQEHYISFQFNVYRASIYHLYFFVIRRGAFEIVQIPCVVRTRGQPSSVCVLGCAFIFMGRIGNPSSKTKAEIYTFLELIKIK